MDTSDVVNEEATEKILQIRIAGCARQHDSNFTGFISTRMTFTYTLVQGVQSLADGQITFKEQSIRKHPSFYIFCSTKLQKLQNTTLAFTSLDNVS